MWSINVILRLLKAVDFVVFVVVNVVVVVLIVVAVHKGLVGVDKCFSEAPKGC